MGAINGTRQAAVPGSGCGRSRGASSPASFARRYEATTTRWTATARSWRALWTRWRTWTFRPRSWIRSNPIGSLWTMVWRNRPPLPPRNSGTATVSCVGATTPPSYRTPSAAQPNVGSGKHETRSVHTRTTTAGIPGRPLLVRAALSRGHQRQAWGAHRVVGWTSSPPPAQRGLPHRRSRRPEQCRDGMLRAWATGQLELDNSFAAGDRIPS